MSVPRYAPLTNSHHSSAQDFSGKVPPCSQHPFVRLCHVVVSLRFILCGGTKRFRRTYCTVLIPLVIAVLYRLDGDAHHTVTSSRAAAMRLVEGPTNMLCNSPV